MTDKNLTLPGDIPGLLRRGSPVWIRHAMGRWPAVVEEDPAEHDREGGHWMIQFGTHFVGARSVSLDLSDPTGRAHAAWWLAAEVAGMGSVAVWDGTPDGAQGDRFCWWRLRWRSVSWPNPPAATGCQTYTPRDVPGLHGLDPDDPRTLRDGSRWVDAEALRRVVLHVAGREVTRG